MKVKITKPIQGGEVRAIASKSEAHRLLICAALADRETFISCPERSEDIDATAQCLQSLGATIRYEHNGFFVSPVDRGAGNAILNCGEKTGAGTANTYPREYTLDCGESGSTLRFLLPVCGALGINASFHMLGRLPQRPLNALYDEMTSHGCTLSQQGVSPLICKGRLKSGNYTLPGNISSQYVSGLLFALPLLSGDSTIRVTGVLESRPYVDMTLEKLLLFGINIIERETNVSILASESICDSSAEDFCRQAVWMSRRNAFAFQGSAASSGGKKTGAGTANTFAREYHISGNQIYRSPKTVQTGGDWSNSAFWLSAGAIGQNGVTCTNLDLASKQGDRRITEFLERYGARVAYEKNSVAVSSGTLRGIDIDAGDTPDLVPVLAAVASVAEGKTVIRNAGRLRMKESDRLNTVAASLSNLGADITETEDGLVITGKKKLAGGETQSFGDHRIAMTAAVLSAACTGDVVIRDAEAVRKSYPGFFEDFTALGGVWEEM